MEPIAGPSERGGTISAGRSLRIRPEPLGWERRHDHSDRKSKAGISMTAVRFSGGEAIEVNLSLNEVRRLLQEAIEKRVLLELQAPDGRVVIINPEQVQILQDTDAAHLPSGISDRIPA